MSDDLPNHTEQRLMEEIRKLRLALEALICASSRPIEGPAWATPEAKNRNREMYEKALNDACECFPPDYNGLDEMARSN